MGITIVGGSPLTDTVRNAMSEREMLRTFIRTRLNKQLSTPTIVLLRCGYLRRHRRRRPAGGEVTTGGVDADSGSGMGSVDDQVGGDGDAYVCYGGWPGAIEHQIAGLER